MAFQPVKQETDGKKARRVIWSTESIDMAVTGLERGQKLVANPFYENNVKLLKGDLVFERTREEIDEWIKCEGDILYFSNQYCKLMTPQGIKNITLRDYQERYLKHLTASQLSIYLAVRQCGKCLDAGSFIYIKGIYPPNTNHQNRTDQTVVSQSHYDYLKKHYWDQEHECFKMPIFELYNLYDESSSWAAKYYIYKLLYSKGGISKWKLALLSLLNNTLSEDYKIIRSRLMRGIMVLGQDGWKPAGYIHMTKPMVPYKVILENGNQIVVADTHIFYDQLYNEIYAKDLEPGHTHLMTKTGPSKVISVQCMGPKINMFDISVLNDPMYSYYGNDILNHNTTTSAIYLLHYALFNVDKNVLVLGNKRKTAVEILDKIKKIYLELPYFLKPGIYKWNESEIVFDNGCRIMAEATTINSGIGFTYHCVLADEFAHIPPNILDDFYSNLFPVVTAGKAKFIITSTQNGYNLFYRLYKAAEAGDNDYAPFITDWWEVPEWNPEKQCWEKRDEEWHDRQVANYGSEEAFNKQFGTNFEASANTLVAQKSMRKQFQESIEFVNKDLLGIPHSESFVWHPDFNPMTDLRTNYIICTLDLAEGIGGDYTVIMFHRMIDPGEQKFECVGRFRNNKIQRSAVAQMLVDLCSNYCVPERLLISFERNTYGDLFINQLLNYVNDYNKNFDLNCLVRYYYSNRTEYGIKITSGNKNTYCLLFKEAFERGNIKNRDITFLNELNNFTEQNGKYAASFGHDDMVMATIQLAAVTQTPQFKFMLNEFNSGAELLRNSQITADIYDLNGYVPGSVPQDSIYNINDVQMLPDLYDTGTSKYDRIKNRINNYL